MLIKRGLIFISSFSNGRLSVVVAIHVHDRKLSFEQPIPVQTQSQLPVHVERPIPFLELFGRIELNQVIVFDEACADDVYAHQLFIMVDHLHNRVQ